ncbi:hypothetical protein R2Q26_15245 [Nitrosomonas sp. Is37]|nr:hypothetical protein [Nitrosomonas sp. Is37]MDV6345877.1 hypothetical protein [Nitrosomonas sp. Is37]
MQHDQRSRGASPSRQTLPTHRGNGTSDQASRVSYEVSGRPRPGDAEYDQEPLGSKPV